MTFQTSPCSQTACVCHCGEAEICLPNIPATALAVMLFSSCAAKHTMWDRGMLLHPAAVFSLGESCITRVVRKDPPPALHRDTQPSSHNRGLVPLLRCWPCSCSDCRHWVAQAWIRGGHLESLGKMQQWSLVIEAERTRHGSLVPFSLLTFLGKGFLSSGPSTQLGS